MAVRMSKRTWIILAIVIVAVGATVGIALSRNPSTPSDSTPLPQNAPDFTLPTITGANVTLSELEGIPVVLSFWSISCQWCRYQLPFLEAVAQQSEGGLKVIVINMVNSAAQIQTFFRGYEPAMIVALDEEAATYVNYCQNFDNSRGSIPFTLLIDSEGMVQYAKIGAFANEAALWSTLHDVLGIATP
jgi:cytochrome c biogenesis protein CcmG/thiol:disulfide interchange protein DsbE